jgi:hypothetical protein
MSGSDKCELCEIRIDNVAAQSRDWIEIVHHIPLYTTSLGIPSPTSWGSMTIYYCDTCWAQQQSRMFG